MTAPARLVFHTPNVRSTGGSDITIVRLLDGLDPARWQPVLLVHGGYPLETVFAAEHLARLEVHYLDEPPGEQTPEPAAAAPPEPPLRALWRRMPAGWRDALGARRLISKRAAALRALRPDVLYITEPFCHELVHAAKQLGCPVAVRYNWWPDEGNAAALRRDRRAYLAADARIAVSRYVAERWRRHLQLPDRFEVIYSGPPRVDLDRKAARRELGLAGDALVVGFTGRMIEEKGALAAAAAAARIAPAVPNAVFVFCGDGESRPEAERLVAGVAPERLRWLGWRTDAPRLAAAYDVALVPSVMPDPFPNTVLEAMQAGCAVVAARAGGIPEIVRDDVNGILVGPEDPAGLATAVIALLGDPERLARLRAGAAATVRDDFSLAAMQHGHAAIFERLLAARRERS